MGFSNTTCPGSFLRYRNDDSFEERGGDNARREHGGVGRGKMITKNRENEFENAIRDATGSWSISIVNSRQSRANFMERDGRNSGAHVGSMME